MLAFGEHPGQHGDKVYPAHRKFFKAALLPFLEDARQRGQRVLVIHEMSVDYRTKGLDGVNKADVESLEAGLQIAENNMNGLLSESLDVGQMLNVARDWFDWGYLDVIVDLNQAAPGTIRNIVEPFGANTLGHIDEHTELFRRSQNPMPFRERLRLEAELIRASIKISLSRSLRVVKLIKRLRSENPDLAVAVPRGYAHHGMSEHFDYSEFEMTVASSLKGAPSFLADAVAESFRRPLTDQELMIYARLSLYFEEYCLNAMKEGAGLENIWDTYSEARQYALEKDRTRGRLHHEA